MSRQAVNGHHPQWRRCPPADADEQWEATAPGLGSVTTVPIASVLPGDTPRLAGENPRHIRVLAETAEELPPVLVHRPTMRVIDGMHRLRAAILRGQETIAVQFFDGDTDEAFVAAVRANAAHGLPLSLADRRSAAARIVTTFPHWSDRAVANATGLSPNTVRAIRARTCAEEVSSPRERIGGDGRARPVNSAAGRRVAHQLILDNPDASLREIAKTAGISPATARDVRERARLGMDPVPSRQRPDDHQRNPDLPNGSPGPALRRLQPERDRGSILRELAKDPSLRFTESGRALLRWLNICAAGVGGWEAFVATIPPHCAYVVASLARSCGEQWLEFAAQLQERTRPMEAE